MIGGHTSRQEKNHRRPPTYSKGFTDNRQTAAAPDLAIFIQVSRLPLQSYKIAQTIFYIAVPCSRMVPLSQTTNKV